MDIIEKKKFGMTFYEFNGHTYDTRKGAEDAKRAYEARLAKNVEEAQKKADKANAALDKAKTDAGITEEPQADSEPVIETPKEETFDITTLSDDDLVAKRNESTGDDRKAFQDEINKRNSDGQIHSWQAADKALAEQRAKAAEEAKASKADTQEVEPAGTDFQIGADATDGDFTEEDFTDEEKTELKNNKVKYSDSYWRNLIYGNGHGSVADNKDAKEEKDAKYNEFLNDNPSLIKAIFSKNSGLNAGERLVRLGELLSSIGADAFRGAYAGFNRQALPEATQGRYAKIYNKALESQYERKQNEFNAAQEAKSTAAKNLAIIDANPTLKDLPENVRTTLSENLVNGLTKDEISELLAGTGFEAEADNIYKSFMNAVNNNASVTAQQGNVLTNEAKKLDNRFKAIDNSLKTAKECNEYISVINDKIKDLQAFKLQLADANQDQYFKYVERYLGYLNGVETVANNAEAHRNSNWNASASVKGGIPVVSGSVSGGGGHDWGSSEGQHAFIDTLRKANIPVAEQGAANWTKYRETYISALQKEIDKQIKYWEDAKAAAQARAKVLTDKADASINDGIVKAPHMKQWLVREDGTRIALNPNDTVYATKNVITSDKDDGSEVIPVEQEDQVLIIQNRLGYTGGSINKDFDYYLNKLRG